MHIHFPLLILSDRWSVVAQGSIFLCNDFSRADVRCGFHQYGDVKCGLSGQMDGK